LIARCGDEVGLTPATHLEPVISDKVWVWRRSYLVQLFQNSVFLNVKQY